MSIAIVLKIIGSLALLIYGMKIMSEALQKMAGSHLRNTLGTMTKNRFTGMLTGMFVTCAVQSSSATTVMTVSFVNAGLITLTQAITVIMGADIGTTLTAWIMSLGFSFNFMDVVFPGFILATILLYTRRRRLMGDLIFGVSFMFFALALLSQTGHDMDLGHNEELLAFFGSFNVNSYLTILAFLLIGTLLTSILQSSAALMAITMVLCSSGVLPVYLGIALVMGENIGTTLTANLAALGANTQARRAALAHLVFNVFGVVWMMCVFFPFVNAVCSIVNCDPGDTSVNTQRLSVVLAAFHTGFNVCNTLILIWFVPFIEKTVCIIIRPKPGDETEEFRLHYIGGSTLMGTPELSVLEAQKEIRLFAERMQKMFNYLRELLVSEGAAFAKLYAKIEKYESISNRMEVEIAKYLDRVSNAHLSDETKATIRGMLREISEIESIGDSCYSIAQSINRKVMGEEDFTEKQFERLQQMFELTDDSLTQMNVMLSGRKDKLDINRSFNIENEINNYRNQLKSQNLTDVNNHEYSYTIGTIYMDIISECEKLGDYVINVVEAHVGTKHRKMFNGLGL